MKPWTEILDKYNCGDLVEGIVIRHRDFGIFLDIGEEGVSGLIEIVHFLDKESMDPSNYPVIGSKIAGVIISFHDDNRQIRLSVRPSDIAAAPNWK
ncbi:MAG: S1 RNA-binding domain-containing protein [Chitinophagales bacterium]